MSQRYKANNPEVIYFTTDTIVYWMDVFTRQEYKIIMMDSMNFCVNYKGLIIYSWCLMSNHLHMIVGTQPGAKQVTKIIGDMKQYTTKMITETMSSIPESRSEWMLKRFEFAGKYLQRIEQYKMWQDGNHPIELTTNEMIDQKLDYIHNNPVRALIVEKPEHYLFRSARDYAGEKGLVKIDLL
jgi:REP element-mobilizing transposase RayT